MSLDAISESRLAQVHPALSARIHALAAALDPLNIRVTAGIRTVAQQNALWQTGRDAQGKEIPGESIVTNAKGTQSNHVLGFAADLVVMSAQGQPDWTQQPWIQMADQFSLRSGTEWGDKPHLELIEVPAEPTEETQQTYLQAGVSAVWQENPITA